MPLKIKHIAIHTLTRFSHFPLRLASYLGFVLADLSGFSITAAILLRLFKENLLLKSQASILVALLFLLGSVQLISLGIMGENIGCLFALTESVSPLSLQPPKATGGLQPGSGKEIL